MKKLFLGVIALLLCYSIVQTSPVRAVDCETFDPKTSKNTDELKECSNYYSNKVSTLAGQKQTLSQAIAYLDTQIKLTQAKITTTTLQLDKLNVEISDLSGRIESIDFSLDDLTKLFISRVRETYMRPGKFDTAIIAQSSGLPDILRNIEYTKKIRDNDRSILISLEKSRLDASAQKELKEEKQKEIESLKKKLDADKSALSTQNAEKQKFLADTKNDEKKYQALLSQTNAQLSAFRQFAINRGGADLLNNQTKCNEGWAGCYYNQRDSLWGSMSLGSSSYNMAESGCFVTTVAMLASHYGKNIKPNDIAASTDAVTPGGDTRHSFTVNGVSVSIANVSKSSLDSELASGRPVMARLYEGTSQQHSIIIFKKEGDTYMMHDPFMPNGYNKPLSAGGYTVGNITSLRLVSFN